jgi:hypothetical protein
VCWLGGKRAGLGLGDGWGYTAGMRGARKTADDALRLAPEPMRNVSGRSRARGRLVVGRHAPCLWGPLAAHVGVTEPSPLVSALAIHVRPVAAEVTVRPLALLV